MTRRGNLKGERFEQDPHAWYREHAGDVEPLFDALDFRGSLIWDPACGKGNILDVAKSRGLATIGSDIVDRNPPHPFYRGNFLKATRHPTPRDRPLSLVCNPPYNEPRGIALNFIEKALDEVPFHLAAFLLPIEFLCGQERYARLYAKRPPAYVGVLVKRPSMPPGHAVEALGDDAYRGGMQEYVWIVWKDGGPYRTETLFLPPTGTHAPKSERRIRRGSSPRVGA